LGGWLTTPHNKKSANYKILIIKAANKSLENVAKFKYM
jgi:hypothetical protein